MLRLTIKVVIIKSVCNIALTKEKLVLVYEDISQQSLKNWHLFENLSFQLPLKNSFHPKLNFNDTKKHKKQTYRILYHVHAILSHGVDILYDVDSACLLSLSVEGVQSYEGPRTTDSSAKV